MNKNNERPYYTAANDEVEEHYRITEPALLYYTLFDYGIEVGPWKPKLWQTIFDAFMEGMVESGHAERIEEKE